MSKPTRLEHVSEFKYLGYVLHESGIDERSKKVASRWRVACAIRFLVNARSFQLQCARVLHVSLLVPVLRCGVAQMDNLRGLQGIRIMDKVPNARLRQLCGVTRGVNEKIDVGFSGI